MNENDNKSRLSHLVSKAKSSKLLTFLLFIVSLLSFSLVALMSDLWQTSQRVEKIVIEEELLLSTNQEIVESLSYCIGQELSDIDFNELQSKIEANQYIESANVSYDATKGLVVNLIEIKPLAILIDDKGSLHYTSDNGRLSKFVASQKYNDLPIVRAVYSNSTLDTLALQNSLLLARKLKLPENDILDILSSEIYYDKSINSYVVLSTIGGVKILFGQPDELSVNAERCLKFWKKYMVHSHSNGVKKIDLRWKNQIIVS